MTNQCPNCKHQYLSNPFIFLYAIVTKHTTVRAQTTACVKSSQDYLDLWKNSDVLKIVTTKVLLISLHFDFQTKNFNF